MFDQPIDVLLYRDLEVRQLGRQVELAVQQLRAGDFRAADACKLKGTGLYRARLDDRNRLLFKFGEHGGRRVLLVLEVVHNHDYARSRFLGGGEASDEDFEPVPAGPTPDRSPAGAWKGVEAERMAYLNPASTVLHVLDKPLSFDDAQEAVFGTAAAAHRHRLGRQRARPPSPWRSSRRCRATCSTSPARPSWPRTRASSTTPSGYANDGQEVDFLSFAEYLETIQVPAGREVTLAGLRRLVRAAPRRLQAEGRRTGSSRRSRASSPARRRTRPYLGRGRVPRRSGVRQSIFLGEERRAVYDLSSSAGSRHLAEQRPLRRQHRGRSGWRRARRATTSW